MEDIDQLLNDFYTKYTGKGLDSTKLSTIKSTYGTDYDGLLKDLYSKYNQPLDDNKLNLIKNTYNLNNNTFNHSKINSYLGSLESNNNYKAKNPNTSAIGKYQHMWSIHKGTIAKITGIRDQNEYLNSPEAQEKVQQKFNTEYLNNLPELRSIANNNGLNLSDEELVYLNHHSGLGGARRYLNGQYVKDHAGLENRLLHGREKGYTSAVKKQQVAQENQQIDKNISLAQTLDTESKEIATKKVKDEYSKMGMFDKLYNTVVRKGPLSIITDAFDGGDGYGAEKATAQEVEAIKRELLTTDKYRSLWDTKEDVNRLLKGDNYKTDSEHRKVANKLQADFEKDAAEDWGIFDNLSGHDYKTENGIQYVNLTPGKAKLNFGGLPAPDMWVPIEQAKKLTTHPGAEKQGTVGKRLYNEKLNAIQADIAKKERYIVENIVDKDNTYLQVLEKSLNGVLKQLESKYSKDKDGNLLADPNDPLYQRYEKEVNQYNQTVDDVKQYEPDVKVKALFDNNKKARVSATDNDYKNLNAHERFGNNFLYRFQEAGTKLYNIPRSTGQFLGGLVDATLDTDITTSSQISDAYNDNTLSPTNSSKAIRKTFELEDGRKLEYSPQGQLIGLLDNNDYTIDISKDELEALAKANSADYNKASMDVNWSGVASGVGDLITDLPTMMIGSSAVSKALGALGKSAVAGRYSGIGRLSNGLANSDRLRSFSGAYAAFYDKITEGAIKEGGLTTGREIAVSGNLKTALEAGIEMANPIEGKILSGKVWDSLSTAQVKNFTKRVLAGEAVDGILKEMVDIAKDSFKGIRAKNVGSTLFDTGAQGVAESLEEVSAAILEPEIVNRVLNNWLDTTYKTNTNLEEISEGALVGFAGGFLLGGLGNGISAYVSNTKDAILNNSVRASLQHKDLFKSIIADLFEAKKAEVTQKYQNEPDQLSKNLDILQKGYDKVTKTHQAASNIVDSRSVFKESDVDGFIPSKAMQTEYSELALKRGFLDSIDTSEVEGLDIISADVDSKLKDLDLFKKNRFDGFTTLTSVNSKIPKEDRVSSKILNDNTDRLHNVIQSKINSLKKSNISEALKLKAIEAEIYSEISKIKHEKVSEAAKSKVEETAQTIKEQKEAETKKVENAKATAELKGVVPKGTAKPEIVNEKLNVLNSESDNVVKEAEDTKNFEFIDSRLKQLETENLIEAYDYLTTKKNELKNKIVQDEFNNASTKPLVFTDDKSLIDSIGNRYNNNPNLKEIEEQNFDAIYNQLYGDGENIVPSDQNLYQKLQNPEYQSAAQSYFNGTHSVTKTGQQEVTKELTPEEETIKDTEDLLSILGVDRPEDVNSSAGVFTEDDYEPLGDDSPVVTEVKPIIKQQEPEEQVSILEGFAEHTIFPGGTRYIAVQEDGTEDVYIQQGSKQYIKEGTTTPVSYPKGKIIKREYKNAKDGLALENFLNNFKEGDPIYYEVSEFNGEFAVTTIVYLKDNKVVSSNLDGASKHIIGYLAKSGTFFNAIKNAEYKKGDVIEGKLQNRNGLNVSISFISAPQGVHRNITVEELQELIKTESIGILAVKAGTGGKNPKDKASDPFIMITKQDGTRENIRIEKINQQEKTKDVLNEHLGSVVIKIGNNWYKLDGLTVGENERNTNEVKSTLSKLIDSYNLQKAEEALSTPNKDRIRQQVKYRKKIVNDLIGFNSKTELPVFQNRDSSSNIDATENFRGQVSLLESAKNQPGFDQIVKLLEEWKRGGDITTDPNYPAHETFFDEYMKYEDLNGISYISVLLHGNGMAFLYKGTRYNLDEAFDGESKLIQDILNTRSQITSRQLGPEATDKQLTHVSSLLTTVINTAKVGAVTSLPVSLNINNKPVVKPSAPVEAAVVKPSEQPKDSTKGKPTTKITSEAQKGKKKFKIDNSNVLVNETQLAKTYLTKRFDEIGVNIDDETLNDLAKIYGLADNSVRGAFHNATVTLASNTSVKTAKHEAFHVLFNLFLNPEQRDTILDQAFERYGKELGITKEEYIQAKLDRTSKEAKFKVENEFYKSQDILTGLEEKLSEVYEDYDSNLTTSWVYKNKDKYPTLYNLVNKIYKFVNDTYYKIKSIYGGKNSIEDLFYQLDRNIYGRNFLGKRKQSVKEIFNRNIDSLTEDTKFKIDINGWSRENIRNFSQFLVRDLFDSYLRTNYNSTNLNHVVDNLVDKTPLELFNEFISNIKQYTDEWVESNPDANPDLIKQISDTYIGDKSNKSFIAQVNNDFKIYRGLIIEKNSETEHIELDANLEDNDSQEGSDQNDGRHTEEINGEQYDKAKVIDPSTKISKRLKELLSNLKIITLETDEDGSWFGLSTLSNTEQFAYVDIREAQNVLIHDLANSTLENFADNLNKVSKKHYWVQGIFKQILGDTEYNLRKDKNIFVEINSEDVVNTTLPGYWILASLWGNIGTNRTNDPKYIELTKDQNGVITQAAMYRLRSNGIKEVITNKIKGTLLGLNNNTIDKYKETINNYINNNNYETLSALLMLWDIKIAEDNINELLKNPTSFNNNVKDLVAKLSDNITINLVNSLSGFLKGISNSLEKYVSEIGDLSLTNVENKKEYAHIPSNYITRQFDKLKNNTKEWINSKRFYKTTDDKFINILFTGQLPFLKDIERLLPRDIQEYIEVSPDGYFKEKDRVGSSYNKYTPKEMKASVLNRYFSSNRVVGFKASGNISYGQFVGPTLADAPQRLFFNLPVHSLENINDKIFEVILAEHNRVYHSKNQLKKDKDAFKNYKVQSFTKYHLFPFVDSLLSKKDITENWSTIPSEVQIVKIELAKYLNNAYKEFTNSLVSDGLGKMDDQIGFVPDRTQLYEPEDSLYNDDLKEYYLNQFYYNANLIPLFSGDPAFYKVKDNSAAIEIGKRIKQINSPYNPGLTDSNKKLNFITLKDKEVPTNLSVLKAVTTLFKDSPYLDYVLENFGFKQVIKDSKYDIELDGKYYTSDKTTNNLADAAAFHNINRRVEILKNSGKYEDVKHDKLFEALRNGTATAAQLQEVLQGVKPFAFGHTVNVINSVNSDDAIAMMEPIQLKDAEFLLVPQYAYQLNDGSMKIPTTLSEINDNYFNKDLAKILYLMDNSDVNLVLFESASKATNRDIIDLDNISVPEQAISREISYEYVGNQVDTPAKHLDKDVLVGTQVIKALTANLGPEYDKLADEFLLTLATDLAENGKKATARLHTDGKIDMKKVQKFLYDSKIDKNNAIELLKEVELHRDGDLLVPLELSGKTNEKLFNGIYKKASKLKTPGVSLINKAGVGFDNKLKMIFNEDGSLAYYEALVSPFSKKLFEFADINGIIDPNKLPKELTEMFLYRIPTEDKYSMIPIKIVGFLPGSVGGAIVLPPEITTIAGLDFDVDKVYGMVKSFYIFKDQRYNKFITDKINNVFGENSYTSKEIAELLNFIEENGIETYDDYINLEDEQLLDTKYDSVLAVLIPKLDSYNDLFNRNYTDKVKTIIKVIPSDENSTKGRANRRLDIIKQITSSKEFTRDLLFGGSKANLSRLAEAKKVKDNRSVADPALQTDFAVRNTAGGRMIGIFASINAFHNLLQNSKESLLKLKEPFNISINGTNYVLSEISTPKDTLNNGKPKLSISKGLSEPLFASTEDIKDPVLQALNLNEVTAGVFTTLIMLNVEFDDAVNYINTNFFKKISQQAVNNDMTIQEVIKLELSDPESPNKGYLTNLDKIVDIANELLTISQTIKIDNYNIGPDLTIIQNKIDAIRNLSKNIEKISGVENLTPNISIDGDKYVVNKDKNGKLILINQFAELIVQEINELTPLFNYLAPSFSVLRDNFVDIVRNKRLYDSQIRTINHGVYDSIIQNTLFGANPERYYDLLYGFPRRFMSHSFVNSSISSHFFIKPINNDTFYLLSLRDNFQLSNDDISDIKAELEDLLIDEPDIANDLIDYIFILGTQFNANSMFKLIPAEYFNTLRGESIRTAIKKAPTTVGSSLIKMFNDILKNNFNKIIFSNTEEDIYFADGNQLMTTGVKVYDGNIPIKNRKIPNDYIRTSASYPIFISKVDASYKLDAPISTQLDQSSDNPANYKADETPDLKNPCKK
jgi:hypothetical protein